MDQGSERRQVLALDGGGYRGIFEAAFLAALEEDLGYSVIENFDLVVGTSTGGIIALGLGAGMSPKELVDLYVKRGPEIFPQQRYRRWRHAFRPKYGNSGLRTVLQDALGDRTLGDSRVRLVIPAYDTDTDNVYLFKTPHHERFRRDWRESMVDVGMATSAAPTYLPAWRLRSTRLIDGGVWANNPSVVGITEMVGVCGASLDDVAVLNLGTTSELRQRPKRLDRGGMYQWATNAVDVVMRGQSLGAAATSFHLLGPERFLRIDPVVPTNVVGLDRITPHELMSLAHIESRKACPAFERIFSTHRAPAFDPIYSTSKEKARA